MINELAGHLWWNWIDDELHVFLQAGDAVYRCSQPVNVWRRVDASPDPTKFEFSAPLGKVISRCLTGPDGCKYVLFSDNTAIGVFNSPDRRGWVTIHSHAAGFLHDASWIINAGDSMVETIIIRN